MADVTIQGITITKDGQEETFTSLNDTDVFHTRNSGSTILHFLNTAASVANVTIQTAATVAGFAVEDQVVQVPATSGDVMVSAKPLTVFNDGAGSVAFTVDQATGVSVSVVTAR